MVRLSVSGNRPEKKPNQDLARCASGRAGIALYSPGFEDRAARSHAHFKSAIVHRRLGALSGAMMAAAHREACVAAPGSDSDVALYECGLCDDGKHWLPEFDVEGLSASAAAIFIARQSHPSSIHNLRRRARAVADLVPTGDAIFPAVDAHHGPDAEWHRPDLAGQRRRDARRRGNLCLMTPDRIAAPEQVLGGPQPGRCTRQPQSIRSPNMYHTIRQFLGARHVVTGQLPDGQAIQVPGMCPNFRRHCSSEWTGFLSLGQTYEEIY